MEKSKNDINSEVEKLIKYKNLLDKGLITESEFNNLKKKIFNKETSYEN